MRSRRMTRSPLPRSPRRTARERPAPSARRRSKCTAASATPGSASPTCTCGARCCRSVCSAVSARASTRSSRTTGSEAAMDFGDSPEEAAFRLRLREWLEDNDPSLPASSTEDAYWEGQAAWHQSLYDAGFFGLSWPKEFGGHELPNVYDAIVDDELAAAGTPPRPSLGYLVWAILEHGSHDIKERFLPGIVNGRDRWCQGFSEPD